MNLAKQPASTVQILGAEKALFRALKTKHETPKYGLIYHASLIGQAPPKYKGKIARVLAAKCSLSTRFDALGEAADAQIGLENRAKVRRSPQPLFDKSPAFLLNFSKFSCPFVLPLLPVICMPAGSAFLLHLCQNLLSIPTDLAPSVCKPD